VRVFCLTAKCVALAQPSLPSAVFVFIFSETSCKTIMLKFKLPLFDWLL